jgi:hypothetical protein
MNEKSQVTKEILHSEGRKRKSIGYHERGEKKRKKERKQKSMEKQRQQRKAENSSKPCPWFPGRGRKAKDTISK